MLAECNVRSLRKEFAASGESDLRRFLAKRGINAGHAEQILGVAAEVRRSLGLSPGLTCGPESAAAAVGLFERRHRRLTAEERRAAIHDLTAEVHR